MSAASDRYRPDPRPSEPLLIGRTVMRSAIFLFTLLAACGGGGRRSPAELGPLNAGEAGELWRARSGSEGFVLLDVRTPREFEEERIPGAVNIDFHAATFREEVSKLGRDQTILLYCRSGNRSGQSLPLFRELGFKDIRHLQGGILAWKAGGLPVEPAPRRVVPPTGS